MVGKVGVTPEIFWQSTPYETMIIFKSWAEHQNMLQQNEWERIRWQTGYLYNLHVKNTHRKHRPSGLNSHGIRKNEKKVPKNYPKMIGQDLNI